MTIIGARRISYWVSGVLVAASFLAVAVWGLKLGIDFTGGSLMEVEYKNTRPSVVLPDTLMQPVEEKGLILRLPAIDEARHQAILSELRKAGELEEKQFTSIGPTIGAELKRKSVYAIILVFVMIVLYISWAFRQVSRPVASWKYGIATLIALVHDVSIPVGFFAVLGHFYGITVDTLFVTALLTILGFSVHDTIVVFDRIRENLKKFGSREPFENVVEASLRQTIVRSINTSLTVMLVMLALYFFGGASAKLFSLAILIGVFFGTYSSIFIASALVVSWNRWSLRRS
ncbi:protein-export membrane protein SecF [Candidatus Giovannonibacteria bacterium RIFCSPLOWO2_01_FULL_44_40]|uniref:Protein-export membrane protein SecF n=1 Tax=Candidatus Giovannonibacteria bacterium RIFCSPHIGHO2_01_FULL_45_23 TaxID=1798325 RepID=A0A1F5VEZ6_9BACT|nr:MAG: protein-export membrane protein SecF [Candidatus Giovannonibacteria bacterium RIFCSPHIGHO2_01_FULL_45_23]OGF75129.1 MAG: protein-export membrane protein SecF [Candidatus Giovannonibacteria bacterium RIFCSPHIGHO2_02_FULL_45_13]OGF79678.1 MAG: protein-export membrane protein SecF [Candidatus Giovannonibacteria bacterium RIFCSPLOWO2_01_FULL_44_40]